MLLLNVQKPAVSFIINMLIGPEGTRLVPGQMAGSLKGRPILDVQKFMFRYSSA